LKTDTENHNFHIPPASYVSVKSDSVRILPQYFVRKTIVVELPEGK